MTSEEKRLKCLELAVAAVKGRTTQKVGDFTVAIAEQFEHYVTQEVNQKSVNLNKSSNNRRKASNR